MQLLHATFQKNYQNNIIMEKEILELVVLGLQTKARFSTENIVNALVNLPEKQQYQWIKTMLQNGNKLESEENKNFNDSAATYILKVTPTGNASKLEIIAYVKRLLNCSLKEAKDLVFNNETFELKLSELYAASAYTKLKDLFCNVTMHCNTQDSNTE